VLDFLAQRSNSISFADLCARFPDQPRQTMLELVDNLCDDHYLTFDTLQWRYAALRAIWISRRKLD